MTTELPAAAEAAAPKRSERLIEYDGRLQYIIATATLMRESIGDGGDMTADHAARLLAHVKKTRRSIGGLERLVEDLTIASMASEGLQRIVGPDFTATLHEGGSRKEWRSQDLAGEVVARLARIQAKRHPSVNASTVRHIVSETVWNLLAVGRIEWRSRRLASLQLNADDYSKKEPGVASIEVRGAGSYDTWDPDQEQTQDAD